MLRPRLPLALLWPTGLVLLVGVLAFFQYKWLGQVSESERDRLRTSLNQRAREFADDFDRDISRAYTSLQISGENVSAADWSAFTTRYDDWKEAARFPQLIRNIYLTADPASADTLRQFDPGARTFRATTWPAELAPVREHLTMFRERIEPPPGLPGTLRIMTIGGSPVIAAVPAIVVPVANGGSAQVVLELDRAFMINTMLPSLVERHFAVDDYHVAISESRATDAPLFTKGLAAGATILSRDADASITFFSVHPEGVSIMSALRPVAGVPLMMAQRDAAAGATTATAGRFSIVVQQERTAKGVEGVRATNVQFGGGAWQIVLQHPAGSLEAAVTRARIRNLSLSFGVLAVLAAGVFLISINAQRAQRLAAQQMDFVATVSHELRTPLAVIRSAAQNLSAGVVHEPAQAKRYGELIDAEGRRLTDMVEQVLIYAGMSDTKRAASTAPTDIVTVTRDVVASSDALIRDAGFTVEFTAPDAMSDVPLDEGAYRRALNNLIGNALKYGTDGAWLGVDVRVATAKSGRSEVQVAVSDRGRGIDARDLPHIFEAFYRGEYAKERQIHGNGLGLSLVKGIADAHGGRVTVTSTPGAGATFTLHLPA